MDVSIFVAQDGSAQYEDVQSAIDAIHDDNKGKVVIKIKPGVYNGTVHIPKKKNFINLQGLSGGETRLTWHNTATTEKDGVKLGTFKCGTVIVDGSDFKAENITFENSAPQAHLQESGPAVAVRVSGERCAFINCKFLGWQDTLYLHHGHHYLKGCDIEGSVDFICGDAAARFEDCSLHCKSDGWITAQKRSSDLSSTVSNDSSTGFVFQGCTITGNGKSSYAYLGRPWGPFARVLFAQTSMDNCIKPEGWDTTWKVENKDNKWEEKDYHQTVSFYEYQCTGPRINTLGINNSNVLILGRPSQQKDDEVNYLMSSSFIDPNNSWLVVKDGIKTQNDQHTEKQ